MERWVVTQEALKVLQIQMLTSRCKFEVALFLAFAPSAVLLSDWRNVVRHVVAEADERALRQHQLADSLCERTHTSSV